MKRDSGFALACFLAFVFLLLACQFVANAGEVGGRPTGDSRRPADVGLGTGNAGRKAEVTARAVKADTGRKDAKGKAVTREFPVMFDIAKRAQDERAEKHKKGAEKK